ncbi:MAG: FkbM family methyltransferase [Cyanobacteriota bacterium]
MKTITLPLPLTWLQPFDFPHKLGICERIFGKALARHGICWVHTAAGIDWKLDLSFIPHRWIVYGKYEGASFLNWARKFLPPNGVVVDSGANIGQMLLYLAQWVPQGKILAFEPGTKQADWLAECLAAHPTLPVELIRHGLGSSPAQLRLDSWGSDSIHGCWARVSASEGEPIQIVRLEDELSSRSIETVDLWKIDVEGYEIPAMQGAENLIKEQRIRAIYVELTSANGQGKAVIDYLKQFGYQCYIFDQRGRLFNPLQQMDFQIPSWINGLFLPNSDLSIIE